MVPLKVVLVSPLMCLILSQHKHDPALALFISVREAPVELLLGGHYYCASGRER